MEDMAKRIAAVPLAGGLVDTLQQHAVRMQAEQCRRELDSLEAQLQQAAGRMQDSRHAGGKRPGENRQQYRARVYGRAT